MPTALASINVARPRPSVRECVAEWHSPEKFRVQHVNFGA